MAHNDTKKEVNGKRDRLTQLAIRMKKGDRRAAAELYDELLPKVYGFVFTRTSKREVAEDLEEVSLTYADLVGHSGLPGGLAIRLPKLLVQIGLAASGAEASRKIAEKAVKLDGELATNATISLANLPSRLVVRLGKRAKVAVIS